MGHCRDWLVSRGQEVLRAEEVSRIPGPGKSLYSIPDALEPLAVFATGKWLCLSTFPCGNLALLLPWEQHIGRAEVEAGVATDRDLKSGLCCSSVGCSVSRVQNEPLHLWASVWLGQVVS